jgi:hypothetical protein
MNRLDASFMTRRQKWDGILALDGVTKNPNSPIQIEELTKMLFAHPQGSGAMRRVATRFNLGQLSRRIDLRVVYDVVVVFAALLIGAFLWLALAQPFPARPNSAFEPKNCSFMEREGKPCAPVLRSH